MTGKGGRYMQKYKKIMLFMLIAAVLSTGISACRKGASHASASAAGYYVSENC